MSGGKVERIEAAADQAASAVFAAAAGYASFNLVAPQNWVAAGATALIAYFLWTRLLAMVEPSPAPLLLPAFEVAAFDLPPQPEELVLTEEHRLASPASGAAGEELLLDDVLAELEPDSRVVRLFDPPAMPTPGQLKQRIDRHLEDSSSLASVPDASDALYDALAELRRSLR
jgi:hypothetical protein